MHRTGKVSNPALCTWIHEAGTIVGCSVAREGACKRLVIDLQCRFPTMQVLCICLSVWNNSTLPRSLDDRCDDRELQEKSFRLFCWHTPALLTLSPVSFQWWASTTHPYARWHKCCVNLDTLAVPSCFMGADSATFNHNVWVKCFCYFMHWLMTSRASSCTNQVNWHWVKSSHIPLWWETDSLQTSATLADAGTWCCQQDAAGKKRISMALMRSS